MRSRPQPHRSSPAHRALACPVIALLVLVASCAEEDPFLSDKDLSGRVTDVASGKGIKGAKVTFTSDTQRSESSTTDGDGYYEMVVETDVKFGQVRAEKNGYEAKEETVFFDASKRTINIEIRRTNATD